MKNPTNDEVNLANRVFRGGYWTNYRRSLRSTMRYTGTPTTRFYGLGFRVVRNKR